jgi:hypothetical protein
MFLNQRKGCVVPPKARVTMDKSRSAERDRDGMKRDGARDHE